MQVNTYKNRIINEVITPMKEYMKECGHESGYNIFHILKCKSILLGYLKRLNKIINVSDEKIMKVVEWVVLSLNQLNEKTEYAIIETDARESIYEIIQSAAIEAGLKNYDEDITVEWREW